MKKDLGDLSKNLIFKFFKISRPRFWFYLAGPFLLGFVSSADSVYEFLTARFWLLFLYFLLPANFMLYGINDLFDTDTDILNSKKINFENKAVGLEKSLTKVGVVISLLFVLVPLLLLNSKSLILFLLFLFLSVFYSAVPFRFKSRPVLDFMSNVLYMLPGLIIFYDKTGALPNIFVILSASFWIFAMHLLSAVPDIEPDFKAGVKTSAVYFGAQKSLWICFIFWSISFLFALFAMGVVAVLFVVYPLLAFYLAINYNNARLFKIYWLYPYINVCFGFLLFVYLGLRFINFYL